MRPKNNMRFKVTRELIDNRLISSVCADYVMQLIGRRQKARIPLQKSRL